MSNLSANYGWRKSKVKSGKPLNEAIGKPLTLAITFANLVRKSQLKKSGTKPIINPFNSYRKAVQAWRLSSIEALMNHALREHY